MFAPDYLLPLVAFAAVASFTPGPNNLMLLASGTNFGFRRTLPHMLGIVIGFGVMVIAAGAGLLQLFHALPPVYVALRLACIGYLLYLAWKIATAAPPKQPVDAAAVTPALASDEAEEARPFSFLQAALFQWVNPKAWGMAISAISTYGPGATMAGTASAATPQPDPLLAVLVIAASFMSVAVLSTTTWAALGTALREWLSDPRRLRIFNLSAALALLASLYPVLA